MFVSCWCLLDISSLLVVMGVGYVVYCLFLCLLFVFYLICVCCYDVIDGLTCLIVECFGSFVDVMYY